MPNIQNTELFLKNNLLPAKGLKAQGNIEEKLALLGEEEQSIEKLLNLPEGKTFGELLKNEFTSEEVLSGITNAQPELHPQVTSVPLNIDNIKIGPKVEKKNNIAEFVQQVSFPKRKNDSNQLMKGQEQLFANNVGLNKSIEQKNGKGEVQPQLNSLEKMFLGENKISKNNSNIEFTKDQARTISSVDMKKRINPEFAQIKNSSNTPVKLKSDKFVKTLENKNISMPSVERYSQNFQSIDTNFIRPDFAQNEVKKTLQGKEELTLPKANHNVDFQNVGLFTNPQTQVKTSILNDKISMAKTLDLDNVSFTNGQDEIIEEISKYIKKSKLENTPELSLKVHDKDLGNIDVKVIGHKRDEGLHIEILSKRAETNDFFRKNEASLIRDLSANGIKVSDIKLMTVSRDFGENYLENKSLAGEFSFNGNDKSMGQRGQREDSQRRRDLWQQFQENRKYA